MRWEENAHEVGVLTCNVISQSHGKAGNDGAQSILHQELSRSTFHVNLKNDCSATP